MRGESFIDEPQRELLWCTIQYRDELGFVCDALELLAGEVADRGTSGL